MLEVKTLSKIRICLAMLLAPAIAGIVTFLIFVGQWYVRLNMFPTASDRDPVEGAIGFSAGVTLIAFFVTFGAAVPIVTMIAKHGPLSFQHVVLAGAAIGQLPFLAIVAGILIVQTLTRNLSADVAKNWYGLYGTLRAIFLGVAIGGSTAAAFWVIGVMGTEWDRAQQRAEESHTAS